MHTQQHKIPNDILEIIFLINIDTTFGMQPLRKYIPNECLPTKDAIRYTGIKLQILNKINTDIITIHIPITPDCPLEIASTPKFGSKSIVNIYIHIKRVTTITPFNPLITFKISFSYFQYTPPTTINKYAINPDL